MDHHYVTHSFHDFALHMYNIFVYLPSLVITGQYITHRFLISTQGHKRVKSKKKKENSYYPRGKRFTVCTEIAMILEMVRFTIRGGRLRCKRYDVHFLKKSNVELPLSSFGDHLILIF